MRASQPTMSQDIPGTVERPSSLNNDSRLVSARSSSFALVAHTAGFGFVLYDAGRC